MPPYRAPHSQVDDVGDAPEVSGGVGVAPLTLEQRAALAAGLRRTGVIPAASADGKAPHGRHAGPGPPFLLDNDLSSRSLHLHQKPAAERGRV